jgi:hypothetical protein
VNGFLKSVHRLVPAPVLPVLKASYRRARQAHTERKAYAELEKLAASKDPIIVGPWLSEVGYELLYWIPFLRAAIERFSIAADRLIVVSRGGVKDWYPAGRYVDIFDLFPPEAYRTRNQVRSRPLGLKQFSIGDFDREIVAALQQRLGLHRTITLHPSLMFNLFRDYWDERYGIEVIRKNSRHQKLYPQGPIRELDSLPSDYVAMRFYFNNVFPDRAETRAFQAALLDRLAAETDVVLLNTAFGFDDHRDIERTRHPRVYTSTHLMEPRDNLAVQTQIVRGARAYYGNYGGLSYLPLLCGVPTYAFHWEEGPYFARHGQVLKDALAEVGTAFKITCVRNHRDALQWPSEKAVTGV